MPADFLTSLELGGALALAGHGVLIAGFSTRVIMSRRPQGSSLAWLLLIVLMPYAGAFLYLLLGERYLGRKYARRSKVMYEEHYKPWLNKLGCCKQSVANYPFPEYRAVHRLASSLLGIPPIQGNKLKLISDTDEILQSIRDDIDTAVRYVHLEFYIWHSGGLADEVGEALLRAVKRGVTCRLLLDEVGSSDFFKSKWVWKLREGGIELVSALPVSPLRIFWGRLDLRLHRKIVVIDDNVAYTGSLNLVDPRYFKQDAGVGEWVDAMARIKGGAVDVLAAIFAWDWGMETGQTVNPVTEPVTEHEGHREGQALTHVVPSGPEDKGGNIQQLLLAMVYAAKDEIVLTTPYFVPDEPLLMGLHAAAVRGVAVKIIVPAKVDSMLVRYASRSFFQELLQEGVSIYNFNKGLLHTKSVTVDGRLAAFGTVNLDMRSFWLNFEVSMLVDDPAFVTDLRELQMSYIKQAEKIDLADWQKRTVLSKFMANTARLFGPLL